MAPVWLVEGTGAAEVVVTGGAVLLGVGDGDGVALVVGPEHRVLINAPPPGPKSVRIAGAI